ncbi:hypothetical protein [Companilactobacillus ginsenosidimutans]|uniref:Uncharacterized protein n=1 Tax=Companilactobacillus ginsenosidimutans TaxID=1007676 RepID=A0A0H4QYR2_9LACO|nr:hypothetical protein [Companilactobacillus ginsenosidimutans]AKP66630.1 hypothetical protein ABM34_03040 [Companilactobacillus ginsenosidimutans]
MIDTFLGIFKLFLIVAVSIALFIYVGIPLIITAIGAGLIYYLYKRTRLAHQRARYTPEGRKKVN